MPFKSKAQRGFLFAHHPDIAKRWAKETPNEKSLPEHAKKKPETLGEYLTQYDEKDEPT